MWNRLGNLTFCAVVTTAALAHAQKPALTQNIDEKGRVPYQQTIAVQCPSGECDAVFTIPAGERLVVTHVSGILFVSTPTQGMFVDLYGGLPLPSLSTGAANRVIFSLPVTALSTSGSNSAAQYYYVLNQEVTYFFDAVAGKSLYVSYLSPDTMGSSQGTVSVSGYLVPISATTSGN